MPRGIPANGVRRKRVHTPPPETADLPPIPAKPPVGAIPPTRRRTQTEQQRWARLDERARQAALRAKARKRCELPLFVDEYEEALDFCERFGEDLTTILRTCFLIGLADRRRWASAAQPGEAFSLGSLVPRTPYRMDPTGLRQAGTAPFEPFRQPGAIDPNARYAVQPPAPPRATTVLESFDEQVYHAPPKPDARYLPSAPAPGSITQVEDAVPEAAGDFAPGELDAAIPPELPLAEPVAT